MRALLIAVGLVASTPALADRELCAPGARFRGAPLDLDVKGADLHEVYRLLGDVGKVNIVLPDDVTGKVTLRLKRVPWDQIACTVAAVHRLQITVNGNVLLVTRRPATTKFSF
jgi:type IV pilus assembly protein PilQ